MNKTLYIRDEDLPLWDRARELAGDKLSRVIVESLKHYVAEQEATAKGYERIIVEFEDSEDKGRPKRKAFVGRWIYDLQDPLDQINSQGEGNQFSIAETPKGNVVVFANYFYQGERLDFSFHVFDSFESAAAVEQFTQAINHTLKKRGVPIEELDI